jgi:hypothetical protein
MNQVMIDNNTQQQINMSRSFDKFYANLKPTKPTKKLKSFERFLVNLNKVEPVKDDCDYPLTADQAAKMWEKITGQTEQSIWKK